MGEPIIMGESAQQPVLRFDEIVKSYGAGITEVRALRGVSLDVFPGEFVAIMGPSGCGKSTMLHLAGALESPTSGAVVVNGRDLSTATRTEQAALRRRDVGIVFQQLNLVPALTALENVTLPLELDGMPLKAARALALAALERVGLTQQLNRFPDSFSGGQQQRIAIARATVGTRKLLLADEPTGALDTATADNIVELLANLTTTGTAVVLVTHEPRFASYADRVVYLRDGVIIDETTANAAPPAAWMHTMAEPDVAADA